MQKRQKEEERKVNDGRKLSQLIIISQSRNSLLNEKAKVNVILKKMHLIKLDGFQPFLQVSTRPNS